ncbi:MAG: helix-turn-helix domain-containing protein [Halobacteriota archaeon]
MAKLLPSTSDVPPASDGEPRVVGLDSEDADAVIAALSSDTARQLLSALHDQPDSPSALADRIDTSLQNVQYHLKNLEEADLITVVDTVYSEKGREMNVYAPADEPLVLFASSEPERTGLKATLMRLLGGVGVLGIGSVLVQRLAERSAPAAVDGTGDGEGVSPAVADTDDDPTMYADETDDGDVAREESVEAEPTPDAEPTAEAEPTPEAEATPDGDDAGISQVTEEPVETEAVTEEPSQPPTEELEEATQTPTEVPEDATQTPTEVPESVADTPTPSMEYVSEVSDAVVQLEPGVAFFLGGLAVLLSITLIWYLQTR